MEWGADHAGVDDDPTIPRGQPRPWWAWTTALLVLGAGALLAAGVLLADANFGTQLRSRGCDASVLPGLGLIMLGGVLLTAGATMSRLHLPGALFGVDLATPLIAVPVPLLLLLLSLPGVLGCAVAADLADLAFVGEGLVGSSGTVLVAASSALVGMAIGSATHVTWLAPSVAAADDPPGMVELAMEEAEALEAHGIGQRFRGIDGV